MAETKFERIVKTIKQRLCDWGIARPTKTKGDPHFIGNTAPIWKNPAALLFLLLGMLNLVTLIVMLIVKVILF